VLIAAVFVVVVLLTLAWDLRFGDVSCEVITPAPRS